MRRVAIAATGLGIAAVAAFVLVGMIGGANPEFSRGRSPTWTILVQEILGVLTLAALGSAAFALVAVARHEHSRSRVLILLPIGLVLAAGWWIALFVERAS